MLDPTVAIFRYSRSHEERATVHGPEADPREPRVEVDWNVEGEIKLDLDILR